MRFTLTAEQRDFTTSLRELLSAANVPAVARDWSTGNHAPGQRLWRQLAEMGVTGLAVPERYSGLAADPIDLVVAFEELGAAAAPGPLVESVAVVPTLLTELDAEDLCATWLPGLALGQSVATLTFPPHVPHALDADIADLMLHLDADRVCTATVDGSPLSSVDPTRRQFAVSTDAGTDVSAGALVAAASRAFDVGVLACAAQLLGLGAALLRMACEYATQRTQFGRPIGSFQSIKHHLADVLVSLELARPLLYGAAIAVRERVDTVARDVSAAKIAAGQAAYRAARTALQVHGAVGYTLEHELSLWLTKVRALVSAWGTTAVHRARVAATLGRS